MYVIDGFVIFWAAGALISWCALWRMRVHVCFVGGT